MLQDWDVQYKVLKVREVNIQRKKYKRHVAYCEKTSAKSPSVSLWYRNESFWVPSDLELISINKTPLAFQVSEAIHRDFLSPHILFIVCPTAQSFNLHLKRKKKRLGFDNVAVIKNT